MLFISAFHIFSLLVMISLLNESQSRESFVRIKIIVQHRPKSRMINNDAVFHVASKLAKKN